MTQRPPTNAPAGQVTLFGFPRSTYVCIARLALFAKQVPHVFHDTEDEMYSPEHRTRHPFGRVPVLQHGDFCVYETSAIATYIEEAFPGPALQPQDPRGRARVQQWMSSVNAYFYPYVVYYLVHERVIFPDLGIPADEAVVADALPKIELALRVLDARLAHSPFLADVVPTLADYFLFPTITALILTPEGKTLLECTANVFGWLGRMAELPAVQQLRAVLPPRKPLEHARRWATEHRPGVRTVQAG
jgi:glutathione S-transferase